MHMVMNPINCTKILITKKTRRHKKKSRWGKNSSIEALSSKNKSI